MASYILTVTRSLGTIAGRFEVLIATAPAPRSKYQIEQGQPEQVGVWLMDGDRCVWGSTTARVAARPSACASSFLTSAECVELAAMVAA
jgi:prophage tail gpP-like protein